MTGRVDRNPSSRSRPACRVTTGPGQTCRCPLSCLAIKPGQGHGAGEEQSNASHIRVGPGAGPQRPPAQPFRCSSDLVKCGTEGSPGCGRVLASTWGEGRGGGKKQESVSGCETSKGKNWREKGRRGATPSPPKAKDKPLVPPSAALGLRPKTISWRPHPKYKQSLASGRGTLPSPHPPKVTQPARPEPASTSQRQLRLGDALALMGQAWRTAPLSPCPPQRAPQLSWR